ncbi:MAG: alpha/beta fold hydrolase [Clostridia bacterium]|nr:alpha/beta fold hydrolase [Clostridia bacterium]
MKRFFIAVLCMLLLVPSIAFCETGGLMEEAVSIGEPALPGTLTLPENASSPLPAVVLLHGSGPNDRDETVGQTKMFRDLAQGLAEQGVAVLRFDKRTLVYNTYTKDDLKTFTVEQESIRDAVAAAELLRSNPRIGQVFLIGHSMGAMIAPRIAEEYPSLFDGIILLSGTPKTFGDIVLSQNQAIVDALPALTKAIGTIQLQGLRMNWKDLLNSTGEEAKNKTVFGEPGYYFWEMAQYDTGEILQTLELPALIVNGGRDFQVVDADGVDAWNALDLPENVQVIYHPDLNHLLMDPDAPEEARGTVKEYDTPCHISREIIDEIAEFILK